jgi:hypothetical protein
VGADVVLYTIRGGGHDGPAEIWRFFPQRGSVQPTKETP